MEKRSAACRRLCHNVIRQDFIPSEGKPASATLDGTKVFLPAYIPYVGQEYFRHRPRVLCYAINQNLSRHTRWTDDWTTQWAGNPNVAMDRLNEAARAGMAIPIKPYAEGFIPLVAAMALARADSSDHGKTIPLVDRVISVTNFVKFSTAEEASSSSIPSSWWRECAHRYVREEIIALQPDVIIGFGQRTILELERILDTAGADGQRPELLPCRFPGRIPSVKARPLLPEESQIWERDILPLAKRIKEPPAGSYHKWRMRRFPGYFLDVARSWAICPSSAKA